MPTAESRQLEVSNAANTHQAACCCKLRHKETKKLHAKMKLKRDSFSEPSNQQLVLAKHLNLLVLFSSADEATMLRR